MIVARLGLQPTMKTFRYSTASALTVVTLDDGLQVTWRGCGRRGAHQADAQPQGRSGRCRSIRCTYLPQYSF